MLWSTIPGVVSFVPGGKPCSAAVMVPGSSRASPTCQKRQANGFRALGFSAVMLSET